MFACSCGECILFSFSSLLASALCWSYVWFRLLLFTPCSLFIFCYNLYNFCHWVSVGLFFPVIILDICELILSLLGIHVVMHCNDTIIWVLASLPLLPFWENQVQGTLYLKKICVRDGSRSKVPLLLSWMLPVDH